MIRILIPSYRNWDRLTRCVEALRTRAGYDDYRITINFEDTARGFTESMNELLTTSAFSNTDAAVLVNDDTVVESTLWLKKMVDYSKENQDVGAFSAFERLKPSEEPKVLAPYDILYPQFSFAYITKSCLEAVGFLDEKFSPGHYEDYDFGVRTWLAGLRVTSFNEVRYLHDRGVSFDEGMPGFYPTEQAKYFHQKHPYLYEGQPEKQAIEVLKKVAMFGWNQW
jgi:GT2 family glycosyltransferase